MDPGCREVSKAGLGHNRGLGVYRGLGPTVIWGPYWPSRRIPLNRVISGIMGCMHFIEKGGKGEMEVKWP